MITRKQANRFGYFAIAVIPALGMLGVGQFFAAVVVVGIRRAVCG
jgi:hypothetical protein